MLFVQKRHSHKINKSASSPSGRFPVGICNVLLFPRTYRDLRAPLAQHSSPEIGEKATQDGEQEQFFLAFRFSLLLRHFCFFSALSCSLSTLYRPPLVPGDWKTPVFSKLFDLQHIIWHWKKKSGHSTPPTKILLTDTFFYISLIYFYLLTVNQQTRECCLDGNMAKARKRHFHERQWN